MGPTHVQNEISWNRKITYLMRNYLAQGEPAILTSPMMAMSRCFDEEDNADELVLCNSTTLKLIIKDYCTRRTMITRAGKTGLG